MSSLLRRFRHSYETLPSYGQRDEVLQQLTLKVALPPEEFGQRDEVLQQLTLKVALPPEEFGQRDEVLQQLNP